MAFRKIFLEGKRFRKLLVIKETDPYVCVKNGAKERQYLCKCDCGNTPTVKLSNLVTGKTKSCGCLKRFKYPKKTNSYKK